MPATRAEIAAARTLHALRALAKRHGYQYGWAEKIYMARERKRDGSDRSGKPRGALVQKAPDKNPQDERNGATSLARQVDLPPQLSFLDRI